MKGFIVLTLLMMTQGIFASGHECTPGTTWMEQCNHCACTDKGIKLCTLMACPPGNVDFDSDLYRNYENDLSCTPGSRFKIDCNWCVCSDDGKNSACTLMAC